MSPLHQCRYTRSAVAGSKKSQDSSGEARRRILDAAQALFAAHGFTATTTRAIAEEAGVPGV
jgi:AcrR family transcriptional regulator